VTERNAAIAEARFIRASAFTWCYSLKKLAQELLLDIPGGAHQNVFEEAAEIEFFLLSTGRLVLGTSIGRIQSLRASYDDLR
jgi:hypothetical protein